MAQTSARGRGPRRLSADGGSLLPRVREWPVVYELSAALLLALIAPIIFAVGAPIALLALVVVMVAQRMGRG